MLHENVTKDLKTTQRYIRLDGTDLIGATDKLNIKENTLGELINLSKRSSK